MGIAPDQFWSMSPGEYAAAFRGFLIGRGIDPDKQDDRPFGRDDLDRLLKACGHDR